MEELIETVNSLEIKLNFMRLKKQKYDEEIKCLLNEKPFTKELTEKSSNDSKINIRKINLLKFRK